MRKNSQKISRIIHLVKQDYADAIETSKSRGSAKKSVMMKLDSTYRPSSNDDMKDPLEIYVCGYLSRIGLLPYPNGLGSRYSMKYLTTIEQEINSYLRMRGIESNDSAFTS